MFIGHFAVGFASKKVAPQVSLGWLILAPVLLDLVWPLFLALGIESVRIDPGNTAFTPLDLHDYPYTHSLAMAPVWSLLLAGAYWLWRRDTRGAVVLAIGVFSHWLFDFFMHRPDMPLFPGSTTYLGLGLWRSPVATVVIEASLFICGVWLYATSTRALNRRGSILLWAYVGTLALLYAQVVLGPPPPNEQMIVVAGFMSWLFIPWAWWIDRNRTAVS